MPGGIFYNVQYNHKRKEVTVLFRVATRVTAGIVIGAEAFIQNFDFIRNDKNLAKLVEAIRERKDLPGDHDFGVAGGDTDIKKLEDLWEGPDGQKDN